MCMLSYCTAVINYDQFVKMYYIYVGDRSQPVQINRMLGNSSLVIAAYVITIQQIGTYICTKPFCPNTA